MADSREDGWQHDLLKDRKRRTGENRSCHKNGTGVLPDKKPADSHDTGTGPATVKRIIGAHGGKVWAESEGEGKGTTVCFTLPVAGETGTDTNNNR